MSQSNPSLTATEKADLMHRVNANLGTPISPLGESVIDTLLRRPKRLSPVHHNPQGRRFSIEIQSVFADEYADTKLNELLDTLRVFGFHLGAVAELPTGTDAHPDDHDHDHDHDHDEDEEEE